MARINLIQVRRDTAANWTSVNPILAAGEAGLETDTLKLKYGDGSTAWNSLAYLPAGNASTLGGASLSTDGTFAANSDLKVPTEKAVKTYVDAATTGLWDDRGNFDASGNVFPSTGGSGTAGAILKGDVWTISVAGTLGGVAVGVGDFVRALTDAPGQTSSNWAIGENNIGYVPAASGANTDITSVLLNQTGLVVKGASANALTLKPNETLSANRTLNIIVNDADRTLTIAASATISGTNTGDQTSVSGNAGTATALQTARTINGTAFDGTANILVDVDGGSA